LVSGVLLFPDMIDDACMTYAKLHGRQPMLESDDYASKGEKKVTTSGELQGIVDVVVVVVAMNNAAKCRAIVLEIPSATCQRFTSMSYRFIIWPGCMGIM